jgi:tetratricopeptide (TPR) repeat protein
VQTGTGIDIARLKALISSGRYAEAVALFDAVPNPRRLDGTAFYLWGRAASALGQSEIAETAYRQALAKDRKHVPALVGLANLLLNSGRVGEAKLLSRSAIACEATVAAAHINQGNCLVAERQFDEASLAFSRAQALAPDVVEGYLGQALSHALRGGIPEAVSHLKSAAPRFAGRPDALHTLGMALMQLGDRDMGLPLFENRRLRHPATGAIVRASSLTAWTRDGSAPVAVFHEQGVGDAFMYSALIAALANVAKLSAFVVPSHLMRMFVTHLHGNVLIERERFRDATQLHACNFVPVMSLPYLLGPDSELPRGPWLAAPSELPPSAKILLDAAHFKVGICWQGNPASPADPGRSAAVAAFRPLARIPNVQIYSLQKNSVSPAGEPRVAPDTWYIDLGQIDVEGQSFSNTSAAMGALDLVITVDTAIAHLAGALGKEVWLLLRQVPDWRWGLSATANPWYPGMRIFRQVKGFEWRSVIEAVGRALHDRVRGWKDVT